MAGDVKIGGGHSSFVYGFVGEAKEKNLRKHTAIFDDSEPQPITVYECEKGVKTSDLKTSDLEKLKGVKKLRQFSEEELADGKFFLIHWD
jgi:hypothetical protein